MPTRFRCTLMHFSSWPLHLVNLNMNLNAVLKRFYFLSFVLKTKQFSPDSSEVFCRDDPTLRCGFIPFVLHTFNAC